MILEYVIFSDVEIIKGQLHACLELLNNNNKNNNNNKLLFIHTLHNFTKVQADNILTNFLNAYTLTQPHQARIQTEDECSPPRQDF